MATWTMKPATAKQFAFLTSLGYDGPRDITAGQASGNIELLLAKRRAGSTATATTSSAPAAQPLTETGMYRLADGRIFKVQRSQESKRLYAKELVQIGGHRVTDEGESVQFEFQYAPGAVFNLRPDDRLTLDEAKKFGIRYGVCCVCGATIKDETSVKNGIGPVCAKGLN